MIKEIPNKSSINSLKLLYMYLYAGVVSQAVAYTSHNTGLACFKNEGIAKINWRLLFFLNAGSISIVFS